MAKRKKKKDDDEKPPVRCFDCLDCPKTGYMETYWSREDGPHYCYECGKELTERKDEVQEYPDTEIYEEGEEKWS